MKHSIAFATLFSASLFNASIALAAGPPAGPPALEAVVLTGWLHVEDYTMEDVVVSVEVDGEVQKSRVTPGGRFDLMLPANTEATLRFEKPGHLPKEVTVDTRNAQVGEPGKHARHVKFAVILQLERFMAGLTYPGPVGSIGFDAGGGCVAIGHDKRVVPARRQATMVF